MAPFERVQAAFSPSSLARIERSAREAEARARAVLAIAPDDAVVENATALALAADFLVALGAEGALAEADVRSAVGAVAEVLGCSPDAADYVLFRAVLAAPGLASLPPLVGIGVQLRFLLDLGVFVEISFWRRDTTGAEECVVALGPDAADGRARREASAVLRGRSLLHVVQRSSRCSAPVHRFSEVAGALVGTPAVEHARASAFMAVAARAAEQLVDREFLLDRNQRREQVLVAAGDRRLTRLGFDLHDGPVQDVLALATELKALQHDLDPFVAESHRELARGRFDDAVARLAEIDRGLRGIAHSLDTSPVLTRPLGEVVHRSLDAFSTSTGVAAKAEIRGDIDGLSDSQRIVFFRVLQEALSNVREHSGASSVDVCLHASRVATSMEISDDGRGFDVSIALTRAAQQGRLGVLGISERARLLGGTFVLDSRPGGPTIIRLSLPRWDPVALPNRRPN